MAILKEKDIQNLLERHLVMALGLVGKSKKKYSVKRMGRVKSLSFYVCWILHSPPISPSRSMN
uniref:hypothetical protein n=1 Tax=Polynucleobacter sp. TaxID=2029855 RepID=UPI00404834DB